MAGVKGGCRKMIITAIIVVCLLVTVVVCSLAKMAGDSDRRLKELKQTSNE